MQQIKVKELPERYFITDTYYLSGNKRFVSEEYNYTDKEIKKRDLENYEYLMETGEQPILLNIEPKEIFGTKHIQLIAANRKLIHTNHWKNLEEWIIDIPRYYGIYQAKITKEQYEFALECKEQGKDFFIYKVNEAQND